MLEEELSGERARSQKYGQEVERVGEELLECRRQHEVKLKKMEEENKNEYDRVLGMKIAEF